MAIKLVNRKKTMRRNAISASDDVGIAAFLGLLLNGFFILSPLTYDDLDSDERKRFNIELVFISHRSQQEILSKYNQ
jgi:hypothetical protein